MAGTGLRSALRSRLAAIVIGLCVVLTGSSVLLVLATSSRGRILMLCRRSHVMTWSV